MGCFVFPSKGTKQPISVLSGAVAGCDRFLLTAAVLMTSSHSEGTILHITVDFLSSTKSTCPVPQLQLTMS